MTCSNSPTIAALLAWCSTAEVWIDPRIQLVDHSNGCANGEHGDDEGMCVYSTDKAIDPYTTRLIPGIAPYGHGAQLALSLALYGELLKGSNSRWFGYLQSLPRGTVGIALLWGARSVKEDQSAAQHPNASHPLKYEEDGEQARLWASGTEIEKELKGEDGMDLLVSFRQSDPDRQTVKVRKKKAGKTDVKIFLGLFLHMIRGC
ncbi:hypothetical protein EIP91_010816 [Steccherinum ochraceum]|uniref:Uncharacterized protein n=1 Tax=Steccherinum ochraceum TaxID=92696 RepID=A0A4R0RQE3_9APHY|nr:hypothetical protein EIP91_010816 [Steccherinum ochraceum]